MKRQHPFVTTFGFILTLAFLVGLGISLWTSGGMAFSPGNLSAGSEKASTLNGFRSHADFEDRCVLCHDPLRREQGALCLDCHTDTAAEIASRIGTHGRIVDPIQCVACHADHRGRDFDLIASAYPHFDHEVTPFSLLKHQVDYEAGLLECHACHASLDFTVSSSACLDCHGEDNAAFVRQHTQEFGEDCLICHDGQDSLVDFEHQATRFPLDGSHAAVGCADCHKLDILPTAEGISISAPSGSPIKNTFQGMPLECSGCHNEPDVHLGLYPDTCQSCHTTSRWLPAVLEGNVFAHSEISGFSLVHHKQDFLGASLTCTGCHQPGRQEVDMQYCATCHLQAPEGERFMAEHQAQFGGECLQCHDGVDRMSDFDHARVFLLDGRHAELECAECHADHQFANTPGECAQCHSEPEIHAGFFGKQCQYCHTALAWTPAQLRLHTFPLDHGGEGEVACQVCHPGSYEQITCYGCHEHQPEPVKSDHLREGVALVILPDCASCHPTGEAEPDEE